MQSVELQGWACLWGLGALRLWALFGVQGLWRAAIGPMWWAVAGGLGVVLAVAIVPTSTAFAPTGPMLVTAALAELALGALVGGLVSLPGYALVGAAHQTAMLLKIERTSSVVLHGAFVGALALALGLHQGLLRSLIALGTHFEVGRWVLWPNALHALEPAAVGGDVVMLALTLSTPVLLSCAVADLTARLVTRGPVLGGAMTESLVVGLRTIAGLLALGASWAVYGHAWSRAALGL